MTAAIKILTTSTIDSSPAILLISPNGSRVLINCGEGCQRSFLESTSDRVRSVSQVCLTHIGHSATGGLPGLILTSADAAESSASSTSNAGNDANSSTSSITDAVTKATAAAEISSSQKNGDKHVRKRNYGNRNSSDSGELKKVGDLQIIGPIGTKQFMHSLRHFMRRDKFHLDVSEGSFLSKAKVGDGVQVAKSGKGKKKNNGKKRKKSGEDSPTSNTDAKNEDQQQDRKGLFGIQSIPLKRKINTLSSNEPSIQHISSYLFTTAPIPGKFQIQNAKKLQIPPGPMYARLKAGETVKFSHPTIPDKEVTVEPSQVLEGGSDGVAIALIYCPDEYVFDQLCTYSNDDHGQKMETDDSLNPLYKFKTATPKEVCNAKEDIALEVMIHYTPKYIFQSDKYQKWIREFDKDVEHITIHPMEDQTYVGGNEEIDGSPFESAVLGAMTRSLIRRDIYTSPFPINDDSSNGNHSHIDDFTTTTIGKSNDSDRQSDLNIIQARAQMEYILIPLAKKGLNKNSIPDDNVKFGISSEKYQQIHSLAQDSGALKEAGSIINTTGISEPQSIPDIKVDGENDSVHKSYNEGELIFTGTGSAIPCKHRNVTGMYLQMNNGNGMLLDVGEGTIGQLIRSWQSDIHGHQNQGEIIRRKLLKCKAVWISHPHADHHLGLIRFLTERNTILTTLKNGGAKSAAVDDPVVLIASTSLLKFLDEYSHIDPTILGGYIPVDCKETIPSRINPLGERLNQSLGITQCISVPVSHCYHSYALVLDGTPFGRVVYSGDCRPSDRLVEVGFGTQLLIHEATFEDGMEEEAVLKRHSTVGEAISIGKRIKAENLILTHFSQRYPRIPPLQKEGASADFPIAVAFDFMRITKENTLLAAKLTPALRLLYPDSEKNNESLEINPHEPSAKEILSVPGIFANKTICN